MILRRFTKHFTDQNWFAVALDVIVVVIGIFLGLQVQALYDAREDRMAERNYLNRLHSEVAQVSVIGGDNYLIRVQILRKLEEIINYVALNNSNLVPDEHHCNAINQSHIYFNQITALSTITEILSSGRTSVIQNQKVTELIARYILELEGWNTLLEALSAKAVRIASDFSELVILSEVADIRSSINNGRDFICDFPSMNKSNSFKNQIYGNARRYRAYIDQIKQQLDLLDDLHDELDNSLNIIHQNNAP